MIRIEIIANQSVEENVLDALKNDGVGRFYTKFPVVFGVGSSGPRMGDAIWPEENFALVIWCEEEEARGIARAVVQVKKRFPDEGIKLFGLPEEPASTED
jgi:NDP-sugar pyrophosphorylase family protein